MLISGATDGETVLLSVAESELFSRRFAFGLGRRLSEEVNERLRYSRLTEWSEADRQTLVNALRAMHPPLFDPLMGLDVKWFAATLETSELADLRTVATQEFQEVAPDRRLATLVAAMERGKDTPDGEFSGAFRRLKREFRPTELRGRPGLVAAAEEGPFVVFEGLTRLAVILALWESGRPVPTPIPAYIGLTERLGEWGFAGEPAAPGPGKG